MHVRKYVFLLLFPFFISGCATILKGYFDKVTITNPPEDLKIETSEGHTSFRYPDKFFLNWLLSVRILGVLRKLIFLL